MRIVNLSRLPKLSLALALLGCLLALAPKSAVEQLALSRAAVLNGEWWRLWTGHIVHFSLRHACVDLCVLLASGALAEIRYGSRAYSWLLIFGMPLLSGALLMVAPDLAQYRGASGLCALCVAILWLSLWQQIPTWRSGLLLIALCFVIKTWLEIRGAALNAAGLPDEISIVWQAHVLGAAMGLVYGCRRHFWRNDMVVFAGDSMVRCPHTTDTSATVMRI